MTSEVSPTTRTVFRLAAAFTFLAVVMGSVVCATESGAACPTWPGCYPGQLGPKADINPIIEFAHRFSVIFAGPLLVAAGVMGRRVVGASRLVRVLPWVGVAGALAAGAFGRIVVLYGLPAYLGVLDLGCALTAMVAMGTAALALERPGRRWRLGLTAKLAGAATLTIGAMHLLGILTAGTGSYTRCMSWPAWQLVAADNGTGLQVTRLVLAVVGTGLLAAAVSRGWRSEVLRPHAATLAGLWLLEQVALLTMRGERTSLWLPALTSVIAVSIVLAAGLLAARAALGGYRGGGDREPTSAVRGAEVAA